jgi:GT2 family glycosyltransferase/glycosyltransferase involved in cell wall biosynthesis
MTSVAFVSERLLLGFGVDLVIDEIASRLQERGHEVTAYASVADSALPRNYRVRAIPTRASGVPQRYQAAARWWADYIDAGNHDVVFIETFPYFSLIPRLRSPVVVVDHGVSSTEGMSLKQHLAFRYIEWTQQHRYFPRAAGLISVSEYVRSLLPRGQRERTRVVYNGSDHYPMASAVERDTMRARLGLQDGQSMLLYVGRLNPEAQPYKGTADLIEAAREWKQSRPDIRVVMAGSGSDGDAVRIREAGGIPLLNVPQEEMGALYAAADIYLTASRWEGFDLPVAEAAAQGVPSIALRIGAHPEVVRDGETGILADSVPDLIAAAARLADDAKRRRAMGAAAREFAGQFTWARAADGYEAVLNEVAPGRQGSSVVVGAATVAAGSGSGQTERPSVDTAPSARRDATTAVTVVVLNYGATYEVLHKCIASLDAQTCPIRTLLVDNASPKNQDAVTRIQQDFPQIELLKLDKNYGFAGGMNRGVAASDTEFVLLFNNDAMMEPDAVQEMLDLIHTREDVVGIAPKILLEEPAGYIDAIGNLMDPIGQAYNMGIGQLDIGQYDRVEETFGACFAAALLRRDAWREGLVGPMDEKYFMYYEDVDWCLRAGILGYKFLTCPTAVVHHTHSLSTRQLAYGYKYRMIMRNFVRTVIKDFQGRRWIRIAGRRCLGLTRNAVRGPHRWASLLALKDIVLGLPGYVRRRGAIQGRRKENDWTLFNFSHGEPSFFDPTGYAPMRRLETLAFMYNRLYLLKGEERHRRIAETASALAGSRMRFDRGFVREKLRPLMADEPPQARDYLESLEV